MNIGYMLSAMLGTLLGWFGILLIEEWRERRAALHWAQEYERDAKERKFRESREKENQAIRSRNAERRRLGMEELPELAEEDLTIHG